MAAMAAKPLAAAAIAQLEADGVATLIGTVVNPAGLTLAKTVPLRRMGTFADPGLGASPVWHVFAIDQVGTVFGENTGVVGDQRIRIDLSALRILGDGLAWAPGAFFNQDGSADPFCSRGVLRRVEERLSNAGIDTVVGHEMEFVLVGPDGSRLPSERELAETFGASRTSIREALLSLQSSGLISVRQRARARVTQLNNDAFFNQLSGAAQSLLSRPNGVADFQEARVLFECGLARYAARHASPKELDRLAVALAQNRKAIDSPALFAKTDLAFHDLLAEIPRNPIFTALNTALAEWLMAQRMTGIRAPIRGSIRSAYQGHEEVYDAIAAHDVEAADAAMAAHLKTVSEHYWKAVAAKTKKPESHRIQSRINSHVRRTIA